jgi:LDH2 family malate/lactate/ureidoglycolate dehydrogenase
MRCIMEISTIASERLVEFAAAVYVGTGMPLQDARLLADTLVQADLWGHQSHGVLRLGWYLARLHNGVMQAVSKPQVIMDGGAIALIDAGDGIGQVVCAKVAQEAVSRAKVHGIGAVGVRNSNHFGTAMYFTRMAASAGCIGFLSTNSSPAIAPWGGRRKALGSNPWSIAAPAGKHAPMMLDIANARVARGKVYLAKREGMPIPQGWALNVAGEPTTDPLEAINGVFLPMAEHKGYAIAVMMDVLSGVLTGSAFSDGVKGPYVADSRSGAGHMMIALDISKFMPLDEFNARMERLIADLKAVPLAKGFDAIYYPGEIEAQNDARNRREGLHLPEETVAELQRIAEESHLDWPF